MVDPLDVDLLTPKEVAQMLRVSLTTVYNLVEEGELIAIRVGNLYRIYRQDFLDYIKANDQRHN